jgi:hypothetical protein
MALVSYQLPASCSVIVGALPPGLKRNGREVDQSLPTSAPTSAEMKNGGAIPSLRHKFLRPSANLIRHRDKFALYFNCIQEFFAFVCLFVSVC